MHRPAQLVLQILTQIYTKQICLVQKRSGVNAMSGNPVCSIDMSGVHSNIVMIDMIGQVTTDQFSQRMQQVGTRPVPQCQKLSLRKIAI